MHALALGCFHSHSSTRTSRRALNSVGGQQRGDKECRAFSDVTISGRVWRKVPESGAGSVGLCVLPLGAALDATEEEEPRCCRAEKAGDNGEGKAVA